MRHNKLISVLVLAAAGCSVSNDDAGAIDGVTEAPDRPTNELVELADPTRDGGGYGILIFDTTSSMNTIRDATGNTRCYDAQIMAQGIINEFFDPDGNDGDGIAIWAFANNGSTSDDVQPTSTGYYTDATSAITAVNGLSCGGSTPLADALCKGLNGDGETFTINPMLDEMFILTDGYEDNSNGACSGPSGSIFTAGTWQNKVLLEMFATGIRVDVRYWVNPTLLLQPESIDSLAFEQEPYDPAAEELEIVADVEGVPVSQIDQLQGDANTSALNEVEEGVAGRELRLFEEMAKESGGSWGVVADDDHNYPSVGSIDPEGGPVHPPKPGPPPLEGEVAF